MGFDQLLQAPKFLEYYNRITKATGSKYKSQEVFYKKKQNNRDVYSAFNTTNTKHWTSLYTFIQASHKTYWSKRHITTIIYLKSFENKTSISTVYCTPSTIIQISRLNHKKVNNMSK